MCVYMRCEAEKDEFPLRRHSDNGSGQPDLDDEQLFHIFMDLDMPGVDMPHSAGGAMTNSSDALPAAGAGQGRPGTASYEGFESEGEEEGDDEKCSERGGRGRSGGRSTRARRRAGKTKDEVRSLACETCTSQAASPFHLAQHTAHLHALPVQS